MDSLTQILLGASVSYACLGKKVEKARVPLVLGALVGTLPDLDVILRYVDPLDNFVNHRGFSHSLFMHFLIVPVLMVLARLVSPSLRCVGMVRLGVSIYLILATHALLDAMTVYGTQLFWPFNDSSPVSIGSVFIIDPLYTLPLLVGVLASLCARQEKKYFYNLIGFTTSLFYLFFTLTAQSYVAKHAVYSLHDKDIPYRDYKVIPTPFNSFLWRVVVRQDQGYKVGYMSIFDDNKQIDFSNYESRDDLPLVENGSFEKMKWFTKGFYRIRLDQGEVILSDLRMGAEAGYIFTFAIGLYDEKTQIFTPYKVSSRVKNSRRTKEYISKVWDRIWDQNIDL